MDPAVDVAELRKTYPGGTKAVDNLSFSVGRGEIFGLLGPNGSGKTTTVRILVTLLRKTSGTARVGGFDVEREAPQVRTMIGYAGQFTGVDDDLTVHENLAARGILHGLAFGEIARRVERLAKTFSLEQVTNERARRLSGGMRRRLDLAVALVNEPPVLFLDEPTTGLDPQSRNSLWALLRELSRVGMTILLTTQYLEEADRACDRVAILDRGKLIKIGTPVALKEQIGTGRMMLTIADPGDRERAARALAVLPAVTKVEAGDPLVAYVRDLTANLAPVVRALDAEDVKVGAIDWARASLDDVFLHYTGHRPQADARKESAVSSMFGRIHGRIQR